jgi:hypothetical protein
MSKHEQEHTPKAGLWQSPFRRGGIHPCFRTFRDHMSLHTASGGCAPFSPTAGCSPCAPHLSTSR